MNFVTVEYLIFFLIVFFLMPFFSSVSARNAFAFLASCFFYAWWSVPFLFLMLLIALVAYTAGLSIGVYKKHKKVFLFSAATIMLFILGYFKYFNFFTQILDLFLQLLGGVSLDAQRNIVLPLGISFLTFQMIAYVVDVYRGDVQSEKNICDFFAFSFFFPQFIAGPIERASGLLPQFKKITQPSAQDIANALTVVIYAYFVKIFIADHAALIVDSVFGQPNSSGYSVVFGTICFGFQIYADFMAYSMMAYGFGLMLGFKLRLNFNRPYWSVSPSEFWRRWHITLSQWIRDYLYIPLGGNRKSRYRTVFNLIVTMALAGLWHGASWNFVLWGLWHGAALALWSIPCIRDQVDNSRITQGISWFGTMLVVFVGWFLFRITSMRDLDFALAALKHWEFYPANLHQFYAILIFSLIILLVELDQRNKQADFPLVGMSLPVKTVCLSFMLIFGIVFFTKDVLQFIYFQF